MHVSSKPSNHVKAWQKTWNPMQYVYGWKAIRIFQQRTGLQDTIKKSNDRPINASDARSLRTKSCNCKPEAATTTGAEETQFELANDQSIARPNESNQRIRPIEGPTNNKPSMPITNNQCSRPSRHNNNWPTPAAIQQPKCTGKNNNNAIQESIKKRRGGRVARVNILQKYNI